MTLHLTRASINYTLQVSDRLLTLTGKGGKFDEKSNKNVIYWARDAIVTIGYTGIAYLDNIPSDQWIAEKLSGHSLSSSGFFRVGAIKSRMNIGQSVELLRTELERVYSTLPKIQQTLHFEVVIAGWRLKWRNKNQFTSTPFINAVIKDSRGIGFIKEIPDRNWYLGRKGKLVSTPHSQIKSNERHRILESFSQITTDNPVIHADESESILVKGIRDVACREEGVGANCMSILLPPPTLAPIRVRYIPLPGVEKNTLIAYSPWIVGPNSVISPSEMSGGGWIYEMGLFKVILECPLGGNLTLRSQKRPRKP